MAHIKIHTGFQAPDIQYRLDGFSDSLNCSFPLFFMKEVETPSSGKH